MAELAGSDSGICSCSQGGCAVCCCSHVPNRLSPPES
jgi:hypothetical protein